MKRGLYLAPFDELADPRLLAFFTIICVPSSRRRRTTMNASTTRRTRTITSRAPNLSGLGRDGGREAPPLSGSHEPLENRAWGWGIVQPPIARSSANSPVIGVG
jgi:hypothetical protein